MLGLSVPVQQALGRLSLPAALASACLLLLLGRLAPAPVESARMALAEAIAPLSGWTGAPLAGARSVSAVLDGLWETRTENARLREENERLRRWRDTALALEAENAALKESAHWLPAPAVPFVTARATEDDGAAYARAALLSWDAGADAPAQAIRRGGAVMDGQGLVGRIVERGAHGARVLLVTDLNSRVPVTLEASRAHAIMLGTNDARPHLAYWPEGMRPAEDERVVTSAEAGAFPAGLPVGTVHWAGKTAEVRLFAQLDTLGIVRVLDRAAPGAAPPIASPVGSSTGFRTDSHAASAGAPGDGAGDGTGAARAVP